MSECSLCLIVDNICDRLPNEESKVKCKELSKKVMKGEIDGMSARKELLKHVDERTFRRIVDEVLKEKYGT
jgi:hypothetical protein